MSRWPAGVGWPADLLGLPGHVVVRDRAASSDRTLVDPFDSGHVLGTTTWATLVSTRALGGPARSTRDHSAAVEPRGAGAAAGEPGDARAAGGRCRARADAARRMTLLAPRFTGLWWERARLEQLAGGRAARAALGAMLETTRDAGDARADPRCARGAGAQTR